MYGFHEMMNHAFVCFIKVLKVALATKLSRHYTRNCISALFMSGSVMRSFGVLFDISLKKQLSCR